MKNKTTKKTSNKLNSVKVRITLWYTALMLVIVTVVMSAVGILSYRLAMDSTKADLKAQVLQIGDKVRSRMSRSTIYNLENNEEFKNVSIYKENGEYIIGRYDYDVSKIPFKNEVLRKEDVNGKSYLVYDIFKPGTPGRSEGCWVRGTESVVYTKIFGRSMIFIILIVIPFIMLLTALGGYFITRKAFCPIDNIAKTAEEICSSKDIKKRIAITLGAREDEMLRLSLTLNLMLDRIEGLIEKEKQFTSDASHELRTPISVILAQGEYLTEIAETEKEKELAKSITDKAKQVSKLVSRLLLIARIDQNRQKPNREKADLAVLTDIAFEELNDAAAEKNISLVSDIEDNTIVYVDEALFLRVLSNLISNGIKYGRESGYVSVSARRVDDLLEIAVEDNGIGIANENIEKIWDRFYRVDDVRNDEYGSSGLGLAVVKGIVKLHGGEIYVESEPNKGTKFIICGI